MGNVNDKELETVDFSKGNYCSMTKKNGTGWHHRIPQLIKLYGFNVCLMSECKPSAKDKGQLDKKQVQKYTEKDNYDFDGRIIDVWLNEAITRQRRQINAALAPLESANSRETKAEEARKTLLNSVSNSSEKMRCMKTRLAEDDRCPAPYSPYQPPPAVALHEPQRQSGAMGGQDPEEDKEEEGTSLQARPPKHPYRSLLGSITLPSAPPDYTPPSPKFVNVHQPKEKHRPDNQR